MIYSTVYQVRFTKFIETKDFRHRLQFKERLPFIPFVGMILEGYTEQPVSNMQIEKIAWDGRTHIFECILHSKTSDTSKEELQKIYGSRWTFDGVPTTMESLAVHNARKMIGV